MKFRTNKFSQFWNIRNFFCKIRKKSDFKFEIWEKKLKGFPGTKMSIEILYKINPDQMYWEFFYKVAEFQLNLKYFTYDLHTKNNSFEFYKKLTHIKFKGKSLIRFP